jgi:hypothetical protein
MLHLSTLLELLIINLLKSSGISDMFFICIDAYEEVCTFIACSYIAAFCNSCVMVGEIVIYGILCICYHYSS